MAYIFPWRAGDTTWEKQSRSNLLSIVVWKQSSQSNLKVEGFIWLTVTTHHQAKTRQKPEAWTWEELYIQACFLWLSQLPFLYSKPHLPLDGTPFNRLSPLTSINQQLRKYNGGSSSLEAPFSQVTPGLCQVDSQKLWLKVLQNLTWMIISIDANWVGWLCEHHAVCRGGTHRRTGRIPRLLLWRLSVPSELEAEVFDLSTVLVGTPTCFWWNQISGTYTKVIYQRHIEK